MTSTIKPVEINIKSFNLYKATCSRCHLTERFVDDVFRAREWANSHRLDHDRWMMHALDLAGKNAVLDTDSGDHPMFGIINSAIEYAKERDFKYLTWNGQVFAIDPSGHVNLTIPVCQVRDLEEAESGE